MTPQITIGYHIQPEALNDPNRSTPPAELYRHLERIKHRSGGHLVLNNPDFAIDLAKRQPNHIILIRYWPDGDVHIPIIKDKNGKDIPNPAYKPPEKWVEMVEKDWNKAIAAGVKNVAFTTLNEPHKSRIKEIVDWHTNLDAKGKPIPGKPEGVLDIAARKKIPISALQLGIGDWNIPDLEQLLPIFWKISQHEDIFAINIHEYFGVVPSSGMPLTEGSDPEFQILDMAWSSPDAKKKWQEQSEPYFAIQKENWPTDPNMRRYHAGRHQDVDDICDRVIGKRLIKDIGECGPDDMNEGGEGFVGAWFRSLKVSEGFLNIRFWRSLAEQWRIWYSKKGWTTQRTLWEMMLWLLIYIWTSLYKGKSRRVRSIILFCWWSSGKIGTNEDWNATRVDNAYEFQQYHEQWANEFEEPPAPITISPTDSRFRAYKAFTPGVNRNVYDQPRTSAKLVFTLLIGGQDVLHISPAQLTPDEQAATAGWLVIRMPNGQATGFIEAEGVRMEETPPAPPPVKTVTIPETEYQELLSKVEKLNDTLDENALLWQYAAEFNLVKHILSKPSYKQEKAS